MLPAPLFKRHLNAPCKEQLLNCFLLQERACTFEASQQVIVSVIFESMPPNLKIYLWTLSIRSKFSATLRSKQKKIMAALQAWLL